MPQMLGFLQRLLQASTPVSNKKSPIIILRFLIYALALKIAIRGATLTPPPGSLKCVVSLRDSFPLGDVVRYEHGTLARGERCVARSDPKG
jgi:hypothetical protein